MSEHEDDTRLREAMHALRAHDEHAAPSFVRVRARAEGALRERRRRRALVFAGVGAAAAAAIVLVVLGDRPAPHAPWPDVHFASAEPLAFLSAPPSASVVGSARALHSLEESW